MLKRHIPSKDNIWGLECISHLLKWFIFFRFFPILPANQSRMPSVDTCFFVDSTDNTECRVKCENTDCPNGIRKNPNGCYIHTCECRPGTFYLTFYLIHRFEFFAFNTKLTMFGIKAIYSSKKLNSSGARPVDHWIKSVMLILLS